MATAFSLFSGIGGLDEAVMAMGFDVVAFAELDKDASKELARKYPDTPNLGDVTAIDYTGWGCDLLIGGGWPCQPFSSAGKGLGIADPRYMWPEVARALRSLEPRWFVMEQVADILDDRKFPGVFGRCLADLAEAGMHARWGCLRSADVGAPHGRRRLFLVAHAAGEPWSFGNRNGLQAASNGSSNGLKGFGQDDHGKRTSATRRRIDAAGRGETTSEAQPRSGGGPTAADTDSARWEGEAPETRGIEPQQLGCRLHFGEWEPAIRRWEAIVGPAPMPFVTVTHRGRESLKLNPTFSAWMMALEAPDLPRRPALRCIGNAVNPLQAYVALTQLLEAQS